MFLRPRFWPGEQHPPPALLAQLLTDAPSLAPSAPGCLSWWLGAISSMTHLLNIPKGYATTRSLEPPTTMRPHECPDCGWQGHAEFVWDGHHFAHVSQCPDHPGSPMPEWAV